MLVDVDGTPTPAFFGVSRDETISFPPVWDAMGMRGTRSQLVTFDGTLLRADRRCGAPDPNETNLISAGLAFLSLGIARAAVDACSAHARSRFLPGVGDTVASLQWVKFEAAELHVALRGAQLMAEQVMWLADQHDPNGPPRRHGVQAGRQRGRQEGRCTGGEDRRRQRLPVHLTHPAPFP